MLTCIVFSSHNFSNSLRCVRFKNNCIALLTLIGDLFVVFHGIFDFFIH